MSCRGRLFHDRPGVKHPNQDGREQLAELPGEQRDALLSSNFGLEAL